MSNIQLSFDCREKHYDITCERDKTSPLCVRIGSATYGVLCKSEEESDLFQRVFKFADLNEIRCEEDLISRLEKTRELTHLSIKQVNNSQEAKIRATHKLLREKFAKDKAGCDVVVMKDGKILYDTSIGLADVEKGKERALDSPQHFASVTMQFTAMCLCLLVEEGKLDLDQDIHAYLTKLPRFFFIGKEMKVTLRNLLEMRSGLPDVPEKESLPFTDKVDLAFAPGTKVDYSNANYWLLGEIVHVTSKKTLKEYAEENIFRPLGMHHTHFIDPSKPQLAQTIKGYDATGTVSNTAEELSWEHCGVAGTATDMVLWDANFTQNKLGKKDPKLIATLIAPPSPPIEGEEFQYGKGLYVGERGNYRIEMHPGGMPGFSTLFLRVTHLKNSTDHASIFLASNRGDFAGTLWDLSQDFANIWMEHIIFPK